MTLDAVETEFLAALVANEVRFVVIGGHAVTHYGVDRPVKDLDVVICHAPDNAARVIDTLASLGEGGVTLGQLSQARQQVRIARRGCEVLTSVSVPFEDLFQASELANVGEMVIRVVSKPHLRRLKQDAGRPTDLLDCEALGENHDAG
jgi:hypothetical protein